MTNSLDPRIKRLQLSDKKDGEFLTVKEHWTTYEVFHQKKRGDQHVHVGIVHAPSPELALVFAKEQYGRRQVCVNLWVVSTIEVYSLATEDEDMFYNAVSEDKKYRDASGFKVRDRISKYKLKVKSEI